MTSLTPCHSEQPFQSRFLREQELQNIQVIELARFQDGCQHQVFLLPAATQCEIVAEAAAAIQPAMVELIRHAAQGEVLHNDDTSMPVLALRRDACHEDVHTEDDAAERTGVFTSTGVDA